MILSTLRFIVFVLTITTTLQAAPDLSNLNNCINDVRAANSAPPLVLTFDIYKQNYTQLIADLQLASSTMPYVYQQAAANPLIQFLTNLGETRFLQIFNSSPTDQLSATLQDIIPDAALAILFHNSSQVQAVDSFQEIVADLYDDFIGNEIRVGQESGRPINLPTYGVIPPLVKFGNADSGPYTWTCPATFQLLGMRCAIVSLPPAQLQGGVLAWSTLGHETGGHDILHADVGLLNELSQKVYTAVFNSFRSPGLASLWSKWIDEATSDVMGYLHLGPTAGIGLIGYFRALGNGKLRTVGSMSDSHPIDLLRGYLAAAVVKRLNFRDATEWSQAIYNETSKDNSPLYLFQNGFYYYFPVTLDRAIASADLVASVILQSKLTALEGHSLQDIQNWNDYDQDIVNNLASVITATGQVPENLRGPGFYAAHVVSGTIQAALKSWANIPSIFNEMLVFLSIMHRDNPTWSIAPTPQALRLLESLSIGTEGTEKSEVNLAPRPVIINLPSSENISLEDVNVLLDNEDLSVG